jgi:cell division protein FtsL
VFGKIVAIIVALGMCAAGLLTIRQQRTQATHEIAQTRLRITEQENELRRLKTRIAARVSPEHVKAMAARMGTLKPIMADAAPAGVRGTEPVR